MNKEIIKMFAEAARKRFDYLADEYERKKQVRMYIADCMRLYKTCPYDVSGIKELEVLYTWHLENGAWKKYKNVKALWWIWSEGQLWSSKARIMVGYDRVRDYVYEVGCRMSKNQYFPDKYIDRLYEKVGDRWGYWGMKANAKIHYVDNSRFGTYSSGEFCAIGEVEGKCEICGGSLEYAHLPENIVRSWSILDNLRLRPVTAWWCKDELCRITSDFMLRKSLDEARKYNILAERPKKRWKQAPPEQRVVIGAAAMLDFEARVEKRKQKLRKANGVQ